MKSPTDLKLVPREVEFRIEEALDKHVEEHGNLFFANECPVSSYYWIAMQALFPEGERLFIDSARDVRDEILKDGGEIPKELEQSIKDFIRQEAYHGTHHDKINQYMVKRGFKHIKEIDAFAKERRKRMRENMSPKRRLAITIAGEHYTAILARKELHNDTFEYDHMIPEVRKLIMYHAMEEIEHKGVCYDLYEQARGGYFTRMIGYGLFSIGFMLMVRHLHVYLSLIQI